jgi:hypothetical protein
MPAASNAAACSSHPAAPVGIKLGRTLHGLAINATTLLWKHLRHRYKKFDSPQQDDEHMGSNQQIIKRNKYRPVVMAQTVKMASQCAAA